MVTQTLNKVKDRKIIHLVLSDPAIVESVTRALYRNGYEVHSFTDTSSAFQDIESCQGSVSLLITEELMPPTNGFELAQHTRAVAPNIPLVFVSNFEMNPEEFSRFFPKLEGQITFVQTPVDVNKLISVTKQYIRPYSETLSDASLELQYEKSIDDELNPAPIEMGEVRLKVNTSA